VPPHALNAHRAYTHASFEPRAVAARGIDERKERHNSNAPERGGWGGGRLRFARTWRASLKPTGAHYNLSRAERATASRTRQLHPADDVVLAPSSSSSSSTCLAPPPLSLSFSLSVSSGGAMLRYAASSRSETSHACTSASSYSDSPAYTRLWYRYTCVGYTSGYTCALSTAGSRRATDVAAAAAAAAAATCMRSPSTVATESRRDPEASASSKRDKILSLEKNLSLSLSLSLSFSLSFVFSISILVWKFCARDNRNFAALAKSNFKFSPSGA